MRKFAWLAAAGLTTAGLTGCAGEAEPELVSFEGVECQTPPPLHCPDADCPTEVVISDGVVTEPGTERPYFLDYPCDLEVGEDVTFILSMHGGASYANWQRHYFPAFDYVDDHNLIVANVTTRPIKPRWDETDDEYLRNVVDSVIAQVGAENITRFWLAGHSNGGGNGRRIICDDYFADKADGFLSLSGGRLGGAAGRAPGGGRPPQVGEQPPAEQEITPPPAAAAAPEAPAVQAPACDYSHIYATGEHEVTDIPEASEIAARYDCGPKELRRTVADERPGYVFDGTRQNPATPQWGRLPRGGEAEIWVYPGCEGGHVVADVVRLDKGHTEGLEPNVTAEIVSLMLEEPGGKISGGA